MKRLLWCAAWFGLAASAFPQTPAPASLSAPARGIPAVRVEVVQISEQRTNVIRGSGSMSLTFAVSAEGLPPGALVRQVAITKAVDNRGRPIGSGAGPASLGLSRFLAALANPGVSQLSGGPGNLTGMATLGGAARDADSIQVMEGTVEFYLPTETNGAILRIPNLMSHVGRIEEPALARLGIQLSLFVDEASYEELKQATMPAGPGAGPGRSGSPFMGTAGSYSPGAVGLVFTDPGNLVAGYQVQDSTGRPVPMGGASKASNGSTSVAQIRVNAPPPKDAQLVIFFTPPAALLAVPFHVENIELP